ncbi:hypothetical protein K402DRAFT_271149 [Aulographum hederae CBS 113979]|uniref:2',3'-cyclic-nucleotide 3'-phosphodiesterase n=1 Tax=Aulographum hederae CBS 113979 TaxID=1176131 RepID=A0A6G1H8U2_9PEZI|nr:hypothetical protein K402DRAFT_271149 [Aulographum hederae CBS 113979]
MGGYSLWLVPLPTHPQTTTLSTLIKHIIPSLFPSLSVQSFDAHVTLTSDIHLPPGISAQQFLDDIALPAASSVKVLYTHLDVGEQFFKKITLRVDKAGVKDLALRCRREAFKDREDSEAIRWANEVYNPHCSLISSTTITPEETTAISTALDAAQVTLSPGPVILHSDSGNSPEAASVGTPRSSNTPVASPSNAAAVHINSSSPPLSSHHPYQHQHQHNFTPQPPSHPQNQASHSHNHPGGSTISRFPGNPLEVPEEPTQTDGWTGGVLWLVDTTKPLSQWSQHILAQRNLGDWERLVALWKWGLAGMGAKGEDIVY